ncbi:MAG: HD domain-containing protein [Candidatus Aenigmatarchaeota archaeon]
MANRDIYTPQGKLGDIQKKPNLDVLMNLFKIPRVYSVTGFGDWSVGHHSICSAFISLYWAKFVSLTTEQRYELSVNLLVHDLHESVTGDILPHFKVEEIKTWLNKIQQDFLDSLHIEKLPEEMRKHLKLVDMIAFLYEIKNSSVKNKSQENLLHEFYLERKEDVIKYARENLSLEKDKIIEFLKTINAEW